MEAMRLRGTLLYLADRPKVHDFVMTHPISRKIARRFVAGETPEEALRVTRELNRRHIHVTLDYLGENVKRISEAEAAVQGYIAMLGRIKAQGLDATISLKLTELGLAISEELCVGNLRRVLEQAQRYGIFIRIDMEGSAYTERTLQIFENVYETYKGVGAVIQAYLYRSQADVERLVEQGARIRLVKGAYKEPPAFAFPKKQDTDDNYRTLMYLLLDKGAYPAIATHDEHLIRAARGFADENGIDRSRFEFQLLYGIRRDLQDELAQAGYNVRIYVPYGEQWYPYLVRRMAERPANLFFVLSNLVKE